MTQKVRFRNLEKYGFGPNVMKKTRICRKCGQISRNGFLFCRGCGAFLPRETLYDLYLRKHTCCEKCGTVLTEDAKYCPGCGRKTQTAEE